MHRPFRLVILLAGLILLAGAIPPSVAADDGILIVLNKSDHEAALVDPESYEVITKLKTGLGPHEAAISHDGRFAFVTNYGAFNLFRETGGQRGGPGNTITVLDLKERKAVSTFDLGEYQQPHGIQVSADGSVFWVTVEAAKAVLEVNAGDGSIQKKWGTNQDTSHMIVATPDEKRLYVANIRSGSVTVIDRTNDSVKTISTGAGAEGIDVSPDGREVWVTNRSANTISVIDTTTDRVVVTFESGGQFPIRARFTPDGKQVWVSNGRSNLVAVFDAATRRLLGKVDVGEVPIGIVITPDGQRAFVANTNANQITVIDVPGRKVLHSFTTGNEPDGMAWTQ
jgi:YVTN family beta-propeller protein